jgi:hypothetical protein
MKKRVDAAIELGFDAIEYDNSFFSIAPTQRAQERYRRFLEKNGFEDNGEVRRAYEMEQIRETYREMLAHARTKKPDMVLFANTNYDNFALNRGGTMISTEDGKEPGYYQLVAAHEITAEDLLSPCYADVQTAADAEPFRADRLQTNLGTLRLLKGLDEGWKPVLVEFGGRRNGHRFLNHLPPQGIQLAIGECNAALCSYQGYQEGRAQLDLYRRSAAVVPMMQAAAAAHRFVSENQDLFLGSCLFGNVAVVMDDRLKGYDLLKRLARENVQFEVLFEDRLTPGLLNRYQRVLVSDAKLISDEGLTALVAYARNGGKMMVVGESGAMNLWGQPRAQNPLAADGPWEKRPANASEEDLARFLKDGVAARFEVVGHPEVLFTVTKPRDGEEKKLIVHVMNYRKHPLIDVRLRCPPAKAVSLRSVAPDCSRIQPASAPGEWLVPKLGVYSILVLTL